MKKFKSLSNTLNRAIFWFALLSWVASIFTEFLSAFDFYPSLDENDEDSIIYYSIYLIHALLVYWLYKENIFIQFLYLLVALMQFYALKIMYLSTDNEYSEILLTETLISIPIFIAGILICINLVLQLLFLMSGVRQINS